MTGPHERFSGGLNKTQLARMLSNSGQDVTVWSAIKKEIDDLSSTRCHPNLPDMIIPDTIVFTKSIEEVCVQRKMHLIAC